MLCPSYEETRTHEVCSRGETTSSILMMIFPPSSLLGPKSKVIDEALEEP
jgi:hypothetical protein